MPDPREIAKALRRRERQALLDATDGIVPKKYGVPLVIGELARRGIVPPRVNGQEQDFQLTRFGLSVRQVLQEEK